MFIPWNLSDCNKTWLRCNIKSKVFSEWWHLGLSVKLAQSSVVWSTQNQKRTNFYTAHLLGEWHLLPLPAPPWEDGHINTVSSPHLKLKPFTPPAWEPALQDHCGLLYNAGRLHHTDQLEAVCIHFQIWSTFKTSRERKVPWAALLLLSRGRPEEHRWLGSHGPNWTSALPSLPQNPLEWTQWGLLFQMLYWSNSWQLISALSLKGSLFNNIFSSSALTLIKPRDSVKMGAARQSFIPRLSTRGNLTLDLPSLENDRVGELLF